MATVADILSYLDSLAPRSMKMEWDNVGLLCGSRQQPVNKILVALDPFEHVCKEASEIGADLLVTHHPLIFRAVKSVTDDNSIGRSIMHLCANGISAINAHTNLDCAPGGVNDRLASLLGLECIQIIDPLGVDDQDQPWGLLRCGTVEKQPLNAFLDTVKQNLSCPGLRYVDGGQPVSKVAVGGGACAGEFMDAVASGCDTFVTSDIKYNQFWEAQEAGLNLIDAGHFYTENPIVAALADKLTAAFPEIQVVISKKHADCMKFY